MVMYHSCIESLKKKHKKKSKQKVTSFSTQKTMGQASWSIKTKKKKTLKMADGSDVKSACWICGICCIGICCMGCWITPWHWNCPTCQGRVNTCFPNLAWKKFQVPKIPSESSPYTVSVSRGPRIPNHFRYLKFLVARLTANTHSVFWRYSPGPPRKHTNN